MTRYLVILDIGTVLFHQTLAGAMLDASRWRSLDITCHIRKQTKRDGKWGPRRKVKE